MFTAIQNRLIAPHTLANSSERLDDAQPKLLALLALVDGDVLDVADGAEPAEELALDEDTSNTNNLIRSTIKNNESVIRIYACALLVELSDPSSFARIGHYREY